MSTLVEQFDAHRPELLEDSWVTFYNTAQGFGRQGYRIRDGIVAEHYRVPDDIDTSPISALRPYRESQIGEIWVERTPVKAVDTISEVTVETPVTKERPRFKWLPMITEEYLTTETTTESITTRHYERQTRISPMNGKVEPTGRITYIYEGRRHQANPFEEPEARNNPTPPFLIFSALVSQSTAESLTQAVVERPGLARRAGLFLANYAVQSTAGKIDSFARPRYEDFRDDWQLCISGDEIDEAGRYKSARARQLVTIGSAIE